MSNLNNNTTQLEALLAAVNALPPAESGTDTSDATATADEIFAGETAYTADGKVTGTFTIQEELTEQSGLISQITNLVATKITPSGGTEDLDAELTTQESLISQLGTILDSKAAGGSGGGSVETCTVTINKIGAFTVGAYYTTLRDTVVGTNAWLPGPMPLTVECIKGSVLYLCGVAGDVTYNSLTIDGDATLLDGARYGEYLSAGLMVSNNANSVIITIAATPLDG